MSIDAPHSSVLEFNDNDLVPVLFGQHNDNLSHLEQKTGIRIADRGNRLTLTGPKEEVHKAEKILNTLWTRVRNGQAVGTADIDAELRFSESGKHISDSKKAAGSMSTSQPVVKTRKKTIAPRSPNQGLYMQAILDHPMVFGLGPAGTGKTYLAVAVGVSMYLAGEVERLIFTRPALEAGERLGFLPGDLKEKVDPYLRPIYDALHDMLPWDMMTKKIEAGDIEVAPLAFMRGRTLSNAFVILDEAQNTTTTQMKMFLTRMGESSRMVITGDQSQTDLPVGIKSGLRDATEILGNIDEIKFVEFENKDVIRHPLVSKIVHAYDKQN